jgi:hypothetical protein
MCRVVVVQWFDELRWSSKKVDAHAGPSVHFGFSGYALSSVDSVGSAVCTLTARPGVCGRRNMASNAKALQANASTNGSN